MLKGLPIASKNPVKRTSGAFAVKERARCRKKLVVAACRPRDQAVKVLITSRRMVSMMLGAHAVHPPPQPNRTPLCCITLGIYSSICRHLAKYRLGGWSLPGPRGPREEKERSWPTIDREWEGWEVVKWGEERVYVVYPSMNRGCEITSVPPTVFVDLFDIWSHATPFAWFLVRRVLLSKLEVYNFSQRLFIKNRNIVSFVVSQLSCFIIIIKENDWKFLSISLINFLWYRYEIIVDIKFSDLIGIII